MKQNKSPKYKAFLFDMDGVIVDTMPYHFISWFEVLKKYGVRVMPMTIFEMEGASWDKVIKLAYKESGIKLSKATAKKIRFEREAIFNRYFKRFIFDGVAEFVKTLKARKIKTAIVTGSSLREAKRFLPKELYNLFDAVVAGDIVKRGKPYPDPYLTAAKILNTKPSECLAIENAPYGIRSAKAAKIKCFAIETTLPKKSLAKADKIFVNHRELYKFVKTH